MGRRVFTREFKIQAARLIRERGVSAAQAARDLETHENILRRRTKDGRRPSSGALAMARESLSNPSLSGCAKKTPNCGRSATS